MRALAAMLRWLSPGILVLASLLAIGGPGPVHADTGTYRILDYVTTLEPQSDGAVRITYEQKWQVLSGNIPWITVGLANSSFAVEDWGGAAARVYASNSGGWSGVRVDLDRTYLAGATFNVRFTVLQNKLLERLTAEKKWRVDFVPGWYDQAVTDRLQVKLISPVSLDSFAVVNPAPASSANKVITWEKTDLGPGARFPVKVESQDGSFLSATAPAARRGPSPWPVVAGIVIGAVVLGLITVAVRRAGKARDAALKERIAATERDMALDKTRKDEVEKGFREYVIEEDIKPDEQGRYYDRGYGNYITPAIWSAVILQEQQRKVADAAAAATRNASCACACVSCACACACACAGGGAAGCARKTLHRCRECVIATPSAGR
jgi:hypothetical protein